MSILRELPENVMKLLVVSYFSGRRFYVTLYRVMGRFGVGDREDLAGYHGRN